jgi:hypothetical protein
MIVSSCISDKAVKGEASQIQGRGLFAIAPIATGEIVTIKGGHIVDAARLHSLPERLQNSEIFDDCEEQMECRCGSQSCRHLITGRDWQRADLQRKYGRYFSTYLLGRRGAASRATAAPPGGRA